MTAPDRSARPLQVAALTRYGELGASSRVRMTQYAGALASVGIQLGAWPLLGDDYLRTKYRTGRTDWRQVLQAYGQRARTLPAARQARILWLEKELWPWAPAWLERLALAGRPVVLDFDDAIFHLYDQHRHPLVRQLWGRKIDRLMRAATLVTAGNAYLADRARAAGARRVELLPTVIDLDRYPGAPRPPVQSHGEPVVIVWIGSPSTVHYLQALAVPLARLAASRTVRLRVIGANPPDLPDVPVEAVAWTETSEVAAIAAGDIGIMPLPDSPWERGKCGYKLIQYMACGLPVVASPVGVNCQIVTPGENGLLAEGPDAWEAALRQLVDDPTLRTRWGAAGRSRAEALYSLQANAPRLAGWLHELAHPPLHPEL